MLASLSNLLISYLQAYGRIHCLEVALGPVGLWTQHARGMSKQGSEGMKKGGKQRKHSMGEGGRAFALSEDQVSSQAKIFYLDFFVFLPFM